MGALAEAIRNPTVHAKIRRVLKGEITTIERRAEGQLTRPEAAGVVGALVVGSFAPEETAGQAAHFRPLP